MAIIIENVSQCSLCGEILSGEDFLSFPHFIQDDAHPLWRYSDSGMHRLCFVAWDHAEAFRSAFNTISPELWPNHPREMGADGLIVEVDRTAI